MVTKGPSNSGTLDQGRERKTGWIQQMQAMSTESLGSGKDTPSRTVDRVVK